MTSRPRWMRTRRAYGASAVAALVVLAGFVALGRWEARHHAARENALMTAVYRMATSDGLASERLSAYRLGPTTDCLLYSPPGHPTWITALEVCFDPHGQVVETVDRRTPTPHIASLLEQPDLSTLRVPVHRLLGLFQSMGLFHSILAGYSPKSSTLPVGFDDIGARHIPHRPRP